MEMTETILSRKLFNNQKRPESYTGRMKRDRFSSPDKAFSMSSITSGTNTICWEHVLLESAFPDATIIVHERVQIAERRYDKWQLANHVVYFDITK